MSSNVRIPPQTLLLSVIERYERGQVLDALHLAERFAPLKAWTGVEGCSLASRIAANAGAARLASRLAVRAWRTDKTHPVAQLQLGFELGMRRGPVALWAAMRQWPACVNPTPAQEADLLALRGRTMADLRDFSAAEELLNRAESLGTKQAWVHLQRSHLLERQDRIEEALGAARAASTLHPYGCYRPGAQVEAHLLQLLDRDGEAIDLLEQANSALQSGPVAAQLYSLLAENGRWREAERALQHHVSLSPLMEPAGIKWIDSQHARVAYHLGRRTEARCYASRLDDEFHKSFAQKLDSEPEAPERAQLAVTFVRQHFKTCAPATMAALGRYWGLPAEHLKMAEAMCYDGTPHWQQREWAEANGWHVREFRVTYDSAVALLTRGIPFAISTVDATSAHMQAVVGFDNTRGTLLLRDPGQPYVVEVPGKEFLDRYRAFGPHGMVFLPAPNCERLNELALPDSVPYDLHHQVCLALSRQNRSGAAAVLTDMSERFPGHELVWEARLALASYDANTN